MISQTQALQAVNTAERVYGLQPGELAAIWEQESGRSTDLGLSGILTSSGKQAQGPFQIVPSIWGPLPASFEGQALLSASILAQGGSDPDTRAGSYYGLGKADPGQPTTKEYVSEVAARRAKIQGSDSSPSYYRDENGKLIINIGGEEQGEEKANVESDQGVGFSFANVLCALLERIGVGCPDPKSILVGIIGAIFLMTTIFRAAKSGQKTVIQLAGGKP